MKEWVRRWNWKVDEQERRRGKVSFFYAELLEELQGKEENDLLGGQGESKEDTLVQKDHQGLRGGDKK